MWYDFNYMISYKKGVTKMAFDGIVTKAIVLELQQLIGGRIDKIYEPTKNDILLGFYLNGVNYALNICTDAQNYRLHLTTHSKPNPKYAPNFCMLLRKNLIGLKIKNIISTDLERVVTIEFEGFDDVDDIITKKLIIELMGRHCNIILLDENNIIVDSLRHISSDNELTRDIIPHVKYLYPTTNKINFLEVIDFNDFKLKLNIDFKDYLVNNLPACISNTFNGISKRFIEHCIHILNIDTSATLDNTILEKIYNYIYSIILSTDSLNLGFDIIKDTNGNVKDYVLTKKEENAPFALNDFIKSLSENAKIKTISFNTEKLSDWDSSFVSFLYQVLLIIKEKKLGYSLENLPDNLKHLLELSFERALIPPSATSDPARVP